MAFVSYAILLSAVVIACLVPRSVWIDALLAAGVGPTLLMPWATEASIARLVDAGGGAEFAKSVLCDVAASGKSSDAVVGFLLSRGIVDDEDVGGLESEEQGGQADIMRAFCNQGVILKDASRRAVLFYLSRGANATLMLGTFALGKRADIVKLLLAHGANPTEGLRVVVFSGDVEMAKLFIAAGGDVNEGMRMCQSQDMGKLLIEKGADPNSAWTVVMGSRDKFELSLFLLAHGADVNQGLAIAVLSRQRDFLDFFLSRGANVNEGIGYATDLETLEILLEKTGADASMGLGLLAGQAPSREMVDLLLANGADPKRGLSGALTTKRSDLMILYFARGLSPNFAIQVAIESHGLGEVEFLLSLGNGRYDLHEAVIIATQERNLPMMKLLISAGGSPSGALWTACHCPTFEFYDASEEESERLKMIPGYEPTGKPPLPSRVAVVQVLLDAGATANLGIAEASIGRCVQSKDVVRLLLQKGADPNLGVEAAASTHGAEILSALLDAGGDANLGVAAAASILGSPTLSLLLDRGANPQKGLLAACALGFGENVRLLARKGGMGDLPSCIESAAQAALPDALNAVLDHGVDPSLGLKSAITSARIGNIKILLQRGGDVEKALDLVRSLGYVSLNHVDLIQQVEALIEELRKPAEDKTK